MERIFDLEHLFSYHPPTEGQPEKYVRIRDAAKAYALVVLECTPPSADQSDAIRKIRESVMTANSAVSLDGRLYIERSIQDIGSAVPAPGPGQPIGNE